MKQKDKIHTFKIPIYECNVVVAFSDNFRKTGKKFKQKLRSEANDNSGLAFKMNQFCTEYMILIRHKYKRDLGVISHEALHITNYILGDRGVKVTLYNDEAQTYLLGYIMNKINKILTK